MRFSLSMVAAMFVAHSAMSEPLMLGPPMGAAWTAVYGLPPGKPDSFVPQARTIGAKSTRLTLYWSQLEPAPQVRRWDELDAYLAQLGPADEAVLTLASSSPWATQVSGWVFPSSPAKDPKAYYAFVRAVVEHAKGKIRFFQSDPEPNNPFYWSAGVDAFAAQQAIFYRAVKDADHAALVVLGGCDGLFDPAGKDPLPHQDNTLSFYSALIAKTAGSYDVFDLRLYANPYTIPDRVAWVRHEMEKHGGLKPIVATEYDGPAFFDFHSNRRFASLLMAPGAGPAAVHQLRQMPDLPPQTRMFLPDAPPELATRLLTLATEDLVVRNLMALASGVQKTMFWDIWHQSDPGTPNDLFYGRYRLLERTSDGRLVPGSLAKPFAALAARLSDAVAAERIVDAAQPDLYVIRIDRAARRPLFVAWVRPNMLGDAAGPRTLTGSWLHGNRRVSSLNGSAIREPDGVIRVSATPVFIE